MHALRLSLSLGRGPGRGWLAPLLLALPLAASAQTVNSVAGGNGDGGQAMAARFLEPAGVAVDSAGNVFVTDRAAQRVRRIDAASGAIATVLGSEFTFGADYKGGDGGPAVEGSLYLPRGSAAVDASGNVYVSDTLRNRVRRIDASTGIVTTFAGADYLYNGFCQYGGDGGPAASALLCEPGALALAPNGDLYIADYRNSRVRRVASGTGTITSVIPLSGSATFSEPTSLAVDAAGNLYVAEGGVYRVRKIPGGTGALTTVAGNGSGSITCNTCPATSAGIGRPEAIAVDAAGNVYIGAQYNVRRVDAASGTIDAFAGGGAFGFGGDNGPATAAVFSDVKGLAAIGGKVYIVDAVNTRIRKVEGGIVTRVAGIDPVGNGDGAVSTTALLAEPFDVAADPSGNILIADHFGSSPFNTRGSRIRRIVAATGLIETVAGNGLSGDPADGQVASASSPISSPFAVAGDAAGNVYFAQSGRVRRIAAGTGVLSTVANAVQATALKFDAAGNLFIADFGGNRILRVAASNGAVTTVAGTGTAGFSGDDGPATAAMLNQPGGVAVDSAGNLWIADSVNNRIRFVDAFTGEIMTAASFLTPWGLAVDAADNLYIAERNNHRIHVRLTDGSFAALAGLGLNSQEGAPALQSSLMYPQGLAFSGGKLHFTEPISRTRVRAFTLPTLSVSPGALAFAGRLPGTTSLPARVAIFNISGAPAPLGAIAATANFAVTHDCGSTLAANASCSAYVTFTAPSVGSFNGALTVPGGSPGTVALAGAGEISLVTHYYESILRRGPEPQGKSFWDGERTRLQSLQANVNETWFAMSSFFFASAEYVAFNRDTTAFTSDLYKTFFNRAPDAPGLQFWTDQMANGMPREVVLASFQHSPEFAAFTQGLFGNTAARAEVDMVMDFYRGLLGRLPDNAGFYNWVNQFITAQCSGNPATAVAATAESISEQFATSGEYLNKNRTNAQYVGDLYNAFLRRGGDLTGVNTWINALNDGTFTRRQVRDNFRASSEFTARVNAVVNQGCMQ